MDVVDSDHKPVRCIFDVNIARVDEAIRRQELGEILHSNEKIKHMLEALCKVPEVIVSTSNILLQHEDISLLRITNKCEKSDAIFKIICEGQSTVRVNGKASDRYSLRGSFGFPCWLEVTLFIVIIYGTTVSTITNNGLFLAIILGLSCNWNYQTESNCRGLDSSRGIPHVRS